MKLGQAIKLALNGNALLFVGSGFSGSAKNVAGDLIPNGSQFADLLAGELEDDDGTRDLDIIAEMYLSAHGPEKLAKRIIDLFTVKDVTQEHIAIANVPWHRIYTTNYDNVIETASAAADKSIVSATLVDAQRTLVRNSTWCVHLNGFVGRVETGSANLGITLTNSSYLTKTVADSTWSATFRRDIDFVSAVIFIGYSVYDIDIARILYSMPDGFDKCVFVSEENPSKVLNTKVKQLGRLAPVGLDGFVRSLREVEKTFSPAQLEPIYHAFERQELPSGEPGGFRDEYAFDLFLKGEARQPFIYGAVSDSADQPYYLVRDHLREMLDSVRAGVRNLLVHSSLGNGKTLLCEGLICECLRMGFTAFKLKRGGATAEKEIRTICSLEGNILLVIENCYRFLPLIRTIEECRGPSVYLVLTDRTAMNELRYPQLDSVLGSSDLREIDVNELSPKDLEELASILDTFGFWAKQAALSPRRKAQLLATKYNGNFQAILLALLQSPDIKDKLKSVFDEIAANEELQKAIILAFALQVLGVDPDILTISELLDSDVMRKANSVRNESAREFIRADSSGVVAGSSVLASHFLTTLSDSSIVVDTMAGAVERADALSDDDDYYRGLARGMARFGFLESILPKEQKRQMLVKFYESIKSLSMCRNNPQFWLQYAIARLSFRDFERAQMYFETSYSLVENKENYNTYQIDNHYARFLLESRIHSDNYDDKFDAFRRANRLLWKQMTSIENGYYPYRVARLYGDFQEAFGDGFSESDKKFFLRACENVISRIDSSPANLTRYPAVRECRTLMEAAIVRFGHYGLLPPENRAHRHELGRTVAR